MSVNEVDATPGAGRRVMSVREVDTIGEAWIDIARHIMRDGATSTYDALAIREVGPVALCVRRPSSTDPIIERLADRERLEWMHSNFTDTRRVPALGDADSYATRLHDYEHSGRDQLDWVVERLRRDPLSRSATITTFQPLSDTSYIPCVSLLDFYVEDSALQLVVYAHSIDFGAKGYANLVELAAISEDVSARLGLHVGALTMIVKSAHVYASDDDYMNRVLLERE